jgi:hypothetical protein
MFATKSYTYSGIGYANPHAVTQIGNGVSTTTYAYDNNGNLTSAGNGRATTTYTYDYAQLDYGSIGAAIAPMEEVADKFGVEFDGWSCPVNDEGK